MSFLQKHSIKSMDDVRRLIEQTEKPDINADVTIRLGGCGMGMPVLLSHSTLSGMAPGQVLRTESGHP